MSRKKKAAEKSKGARLTRTEKGLVLFIVFAALFTFVKAYSELVSPIVSIGEVQFHEPARTDYGAWILDEKPHLRQKSEYDCGPAALAMALKKRGDPISSELISEATGTTPEGTTLLGLYRFLVSRGYEAYGMHKLTLEDTAMLQHPSVAHLRGDHYVTILNQQEGMILFFDPLWGVVLMWEAEFNRMWDGVLLVIGDRTVEKADNPGMSGRGRP